MCWIFLDQNTNLNMQNWNNISLQKNKFTLIHLVVLYPNSWLSIFIYNRNKRKCEKKIAHYNIKENFDVKFTWSIWKRFSLSQITQHTDKYWDNITQTTYFIHREAEIFLYRADIWFEFFHGTMFNLRYDIDIHKWGIYSNIDHYKGYLLQILLGNDWRISRKEPPIFQTIPSYALSWKDSTCACTEKK